MATLSVLALYHFDQRIFDRLQIPSGMDREALIGELLAECAELEVVYPDWEIMYRSIGFWSRTMQPSWTRAWDALQAVYNPLWNVDATIRELETRDLANSDSTLYGKKDTMQHSGAITNTGTQTDTGTQGVSHTMAENSSSDTKKPGFNSTTQVTTESVTGNHAVTAEQSTTTNNLTRTDNLTETDSRKYVDQLSGTDTRNGTDTGTILRETERHGNIGVTSSQQLVREEMEIAEMNLYRMIIDQFRTRFCLLIY